ncbi:MAG: hypothetical protein QM676_01105 [Novosphingobium sp.]
MEALSNTDRFVILLRQKLAERGRTKSARARPAAAARSVDPANNAPIARQVARAGASDQDLRRTIVEQLIAERLGPLGNDARFQQVVQRVTDIIAEDAELDGLLADIAGAVRR